MRQAIRVEWWKVRRSRVTLVATALMAVLLPAMGIGFYWVAVNGGNGAIAEKAEAFLIGSGWEGYLSLVAQIAAVALLLGTGVVVSWVFGREHVDRTFPSLFARVVSLRTVAGAKYAVMAIWVTSLAVLVCLVTLLFGVLGSLGQFEPAMMIPGTMRLFFVAWGAGILGLTLGLVASVGRGYLPAIGALIIVIAASQVAVLFGTGGWFPYAVPGLLAVTGAEGIPELTPIQLSLVPAAALVAGWLTVVWWDNSEVA